MVGFFTFEKFHGKRGIGSTRIRVHNLLKHWPEAELYRYAAKYDAIVYQKVYMTYEWDFMKHYKGIQILDVCDPDWRDSPDIFIKETMDIMDAVVVPTESLREYLQQMTNTPVRVIKDRFDLSEFPSPKKHHGSIKTAVWFGYSHNAGSMKFAIHSLEKRGIKLHVVSDQDPFLWRYADSPKEYEKMYSFTPYEHPTAYQEIQKGDVCILPNNIRPMDRFKSENKTVISELLGVPVVKDADELKSMNLPEARNQRVSESVILRKQYDCIESVNDYKGLIDEIKRNKA